MIPGAWAAASNNRSVASRTALHSRPACLILANHASRVRGMLAQLFKAFPERLLGERLGGRFADRRRGRGSRVLVVQVPLAIVVIEACDVVVGRCQVEVDDSLCSGRG